MQTTPSLLLLGGSPLLYLAAADGRSLFCAARGVPCSIDRWQSVERQVDAHSEHNPSLAGVRVDSFGYFARAKSNAMAKSFQDPNLPRPASAAGSQPRGSYEGRKASHQHQGRFSSLKPPSKSPRAEQSMYVPMEKILDRLTEAGQEVTFSVSIRSSSKDLVHGANP